MVVGRAIAAAMAVVVATRLSPSFIDTMPKQFYDRDPKHLQSSQTHTIHPHYDAHKTQKWKIVGPATEIASRSQARACRASGCQNLTASGGYRGTAHPDETNESVASLPLKDTPCRRSVACGKRG